MAQQVFESFDSILEPLRQGASSRQVFFITLPGEEIQPERWQRSMMQASDDEIREAMNLAIRGSLAKPSSSELIRYAECAHMIVSHVVDRKLSLSQGEREDLLAVLDESFENAVNRIENECNLNVPLDAEFRLGIAEVMKAGWLIQQMTVQLEEFTFATSTDLAQVDLPTPAEFQK